MLLDDRVTIATPEGVSLELVLAGVGSRFVARLLDTLIQVTIIIALALGIYFTSTPGIVRAVVRVLLFLVLFGYDVPFEVLNGGRTVGKLAAGTIVVRDRFPGLASALGSPATVPVEAVAAWDVSAVDQVDLVTIHQFLDRRLSMPIPIRAYFAGELASRVAPKVAGAPDRTHPEYLLEGIVVAKQARP